MEVSLFRLFKTNTDSFSPLDASNGKDPKQAVSDFITVQSFANFAAMAGAITGAWKAVQMFDPSESKMLWVPYALSACFAFCSVLISLDGLRSPGGKIHWPNLFAAIFVAVLNALVLASAVVGAGLALEPAKAS